MRALAVMSGVARAYMLMICRSAALLFAIICVMLRLFYARFFMIPRHAFVVCAPADIA